MAKPGRNTIILSILFFGPLLFYVFLLTGTNNFAKLPVLTSGVDDVKEFRSDADLDSVSLDGNISIMCFLGREPLLHKTNALNLNGKLQTGKQLKRLIDRPNKNGEMPSLLILNLTNRCKQSLIP